MAWNATLIYVEEAVNLFEISFISKRDAKKVSHSKGEVYTSKHIDFTSLNLPMQ